MRGAESSLRGCDQLNRAPRSGGTSETPIGGAQRPVEPLGEGDIARVVCRHVRRQLERAAHQGPDWKPRQREDNEVLDCLLEAPVGDGASQPSSSEDGGRLSIHEIRCSQFSMTTQQPTDLPTGVPVVTAYEISAQLQAAGVAHCHLEGDDLDAAYPARR